MNNGRLIGNIWHTSKKEGSSNVRGMSPQNITVLLSASNQEIRDGINSTIKMRLFLENTVYRTRYVQRQIRLGYDVTFYIASKSCNTLPNCRLAILITSFTLLGTLMAFAGSIPLSMVGMIRRTKM